MTQPTDLGPPPSPSDQQAAVLAILAGPPSILLFKHYWWLTGHPCPHRKNLVTNETYTRKHWWRLRRAASSWRSFDDLSPAAGRRAPSGDDQPNAQPIDLDIASSTV